MRRLQAERLERLQEMGRVTNVHVAAGSAFWTVPGLQVEDDLLDACLNGSMLRVPTPRAASKCRCVIAGAVIGANWRIRCCGFTAGLPLHALRPSRDTP